MSRMIAWFAHNPVAANLMMLLFVAGGFAALPNIFLEEFPSEIETDIIQIQIDYLGAAPEESEDGVCIRVEEAIEGTPGVKEIRSRAVEGACLVYRRARGRDRRRTKAYDDIKQPRRRDLDLPGRRRRSRSSRSSRSRTAWCNLADDGRPGRALVARAGPAACGTTVAGARGRLPGLAPDVAQLRDLDRGLRADPAPPRHHLLSTSPNAIRRWSLDLPGGTVKRRRGARSCCARRARPTGPDEFADVIVLTRNDGTTLTLGEIAERCATASRRSIWPGPLQRSTRRCSIKVEQFGEEDILAIRATPWPPTLAELNSPPARGHRSSSPYKVEADDLRERLCAWSSAQRPSADSCSCSRSLALFLRFRVAIWVAAGVPIALLGALMTFPFLDFSISTMSVDGLPAGRSASSSTTPS